MAENKNKGRLIILFIYLLIIIIAVLYTSFNNSGLRTYFNAKKTYDKLTAELDSTSVKIKSLEKEIDSLKTNLNKIEKVAREKHMMLRKNEKAFDIELKK